MATVASQPEELATVASGVLPQVHEAQTVASGEPLGEIDGYELLRELGRGGMGCVYLARQVSLDRQVAVKTIAPQLSRDPVFLARFVREAFAVAQLSHHNVVQIHDVGHDENHHYFSMEYVVGQSLADIVKQRGGIDPKQAATFTLHAARGLAFAHDHHMVHRDVKPANLLLNEQGLVKVADLGLVKTEGSDDATAAQIGKVSSGGGDTQVTQAAATMGTPAFMPPEQARDASKVDARADIYALGATLYYLITAQPPFKAKSAQDVIKLHATATVAPPEKLVKGVPPQLSAVILKMLAKRPSDRYQTMAEVVSALEGLLGIGSGPFTPKQEHADKLEAGVEGFNDAGAAKVRRGLYLAFHLVSLLLTAAGIIIGNYALTGATIGLWVCTTLSYHAIAATLTRSTLAKQVRQYLLTLGWRQWLMVGTGIVSFAAMVVALGLYLYYLGVFVVGIGLAAAFYFVIDGWVAKQRQPILSDTLRLLREMRLHGLDEDALRRFVCSYSGQRWEHFYEALFGYEAKILARHHWGFDLEGNARPHHAGWRDGLIDWLSRHQKERETARRRAHLQRVEMQRLRAEGVSDMDAIAQARQATRDWFDSVAIYHETHQCNALAEVYHNEEVDTDASGGSIHKEAIPESWKLRPTPLSTVLMYWFFAARARALMGGVLLIVWAWWATAQEKISTIPEGVGFFPFLRTLLKDNAEDPKPLRIPPIPPAVFDVLCSQTTLLASLILIWSGLYRGVRLSLFLTPIIIILLRAPFLGGPDWGPLTQQEAVILIALILTPPAFIFGKSEY